MSEETNKLLSWEEAINIIRRDPNYSDLVLKAYLLPDIFANVENFYSSEEWNETLNILKSEGVSNGKVLDLGAGNGIASYSFACSGFSVVALEPDKSSSVGNGAIKIITDKYNLGISICEAKGESIPFEDNTFDLIYARQSLHHSENLNKMLKEIARVLKPKALFLAVREHVISRKDDLEVFLKSHPLHKYFGGENAYLLLEYKNAFIQAQLELIKIYGPADTVINYFPFSKADWEGRRKEYLEKKFGKTISNLMYNNIMGIKYYNYAHNKNNNTPGRLYSFLARK